jgi:hypothetical protein
MAGRFQECVSPPTVFVLEVVFVCVGLLFLCDCLGYWLTGVIRFVACVARIMSKIVI